MVAITAETQGKHSTAVNLKLYTKMVEQQLTSIDGEGTALLQIRPVHINRRQRSPGIHAVAFDTKIPNSIEVIMFGPEPTGRPGLLCLSSQDLMGKTLAVLSNRLHVSWENTLRRDQKIGELNQVSQVRKLKLRAANTLDTDRQINQRISALRRQIRENREHFAYDIVRQLKWANPTACSAFMADIFGVPRDFEHLDQLILLAEQLGLVIFSKKQGSKKRIFLQITDYAYDLANNWQEKLDAGKSQNWESKNKILQRRLGSAEQNIAKYTKLLEEAKQEKRTVETDSALHKRQAPKASKPFAKNRFATPDDEF